MTAKIPPNSYSSLRAAENKVDSDFYQSLADKVIVLIAKLERGDRRHAIKVSNIKEKMGINFLALTRVLETLIIEDKISFEYPAGASPDELTIDDLTVKLTEKGEVIAQSVMYSLQGYES